MSQNRDMGHPHPSLYLSLYLSLVELACFMVVD